MRPTTMARAQLWEGGDTFRSIEVELPDLGPGELLVELHAATICGSDRHTVSGRRPGHAPRSWGTRASARSWPAVGRVSRWASGWCSP